MLSDIERILVDMAYLDRGLVPNGSTINDSPTNQLDIAFQDLSYEDVRKMKRKYRKYLRKAIAWRKKSIRDATYGSRHKSKIIRARINDMLRTIGMPYEVGATVNPGMRLKRRRLVRDYILHLTMKR